MVLNDSKVVGKLVHSNIASGRVFGEAIWKCFLSHEINDGL